MGTICNIGSGGAATSLTARVLQQEVKKHAYRSSLCSSSVKRLWNLRAQTCRLVHTDIRFPDSNDRRSITDPTKTAKSTEDIRRLTRQGIIFGIGGATYLLMATKLIQSFAYFKNIPGDQLALKTTEINLKGIPEGQCKTFKWRGKPLFVKHRTEEEIQEARNVKLNELRDPEEDSTRVQRPEWLIVIGICSHLGCVPIHGKGEYNAWFCPCHGSTFDMSGRIRIGPAPNNLEVPPYKFSDDQTVVIGNE
uniref:Cytochrome b-c1 complex subunit Rieske, mitochondrial n=1 Tax=Onchocerca volvulus TaxID=6282 RepID=A0A8R1Y221_ONCVO